MHNLLSDSKITRLSNAAASGNSAVNSTALDMQGFDAVTFLVALGAVDANTTASVFIEQSSDNNSADAWATLADSGVDVGQSDDNKVVALEVLDPQERYLRCCVTRQATVVDGIVAIQRAAKLAPVTQSTTVLSATILASPEEGAA